MASNDPTVRIIGDDGVVAPTAGAEPYLEVATRLDEQALLGFLADMVRTRTFDVEAANLQRQGHLALWAPSYGQEAAQVGSGRATRSQDSIFPAYREHGVAMVRGVDPVDIVRMMRGVTHGGWDPAAHGNLRLATGQHPSADVRGQVGGLGVDAFEHLGTDALGLQMAAEPEDRIPGGPVGELVARPVLGRVVGGRVSADPVGHGLDERRSPAGAGVVEQRARHRVGREHVVAVDLHPRHPEAGGAAVERDAGLA